MGMKYYAKSKKKGLSDKERGKQIKEPEEEQKTLNENANPPAMLGRIV